MNDLCDTAQTLHQSRPRTLDDIDVNVIDVVRLDGGYPTPVRTLIHGVGVAAILGIFGQDDIVRVSTEYSLVRHLRIAAVGAICMKDVVAMRVLCQLIAEGGASKDEWFAGRAVVYLQVDFGSR